MTDRDEAIKGFLGKLSVRDLRHMAKSRKVDEYKTMKKKDLAGHLFDKHFMQERDKDKFAPVERDEKENPVPNFATAPKGLARRGVKDFARGTAMAEGAPERPAGLIQEAPVYTSVGAKTVRKEMADKKAAEEAEAAKAAREKAEEEKKAAKEQAKKDKEAAAQERLKGLEEQQKEYTPEELHTKQAKEFEYRNIIKKKDMGDLRRLAKELNIPASKIVRSGRAGLQAAITKELNKDYEEEYGEPYEESRGRGIVSSVTKQREQQKREILKRKEKEEKELKKPVKPPKPEKPAKEEEALRSLGAKVGKPIEEEYFITRGQRPRKFRPKLAEEEEEFVPEQCVQPPPDYFLFTRQKDMSVMPTPLATEWKPIPGYKGYYAHPDGSISLKNSYLRMKLTNCHGYLVAQLFKDAICYRVRAHRLIGATFLGECPQKGWQINHKNRITTDNRLENLEWADPKQNMKHYFDDLKENNIVVPPQRIGIFNPVTEDWRVFPSMCAASRFFKINDSTMCGHAIDKHGGKKLYKGWQVYKLDENWEPCDTPYPTKKHLNAAPMVQTNAQTCWPLLLLW